MKHIYLFLAAMLLLCLAPMPYGYFMLVRFAARISATNSLGYFVANWNGTCVVG